MKNKIREMELRIAKLEREAGFMEKVIEFVPQIGRLKGGVQELIRLSISTLKLIYSELILLVRKDRRKILNALEISFGEMMENAFQSFVSVQVPPEMIKWNEEDLLHSIFEFKGKEYYLRELLKHDSVTGQGAYNTYNDWVKEYGLILDYALGRYPKPGSESEKKALVWGAKALKRGNKIFYRFLNIWLKLGAQAGLISGLLAGMATMSLIWGVRAVIKWAFNKFNSKVEEEIGTESSHLLFDPEAQEVSKSAFVGKISHMGRITHILEDAFSGDH